MPAFGEFCKACNPILYGGTMGQCMWDSNRAIARHLHQAVYRDRYRDIWSPNGALTGAYSGTGTGNAARFPEKNPAQCETMRSQRSRPGSRSTGNAAGTSGDLRPATRRDIARHCETVRYSPTGTPGRIRAISGPVPPQTGVYAADAYRPGSDEWEQCTGYKAVSRGARESVT